VKEIYERLAKAGKLADVGSHEDVLMLDPKAYLRSTRSRFHLNEASLSDVQTLFNDGGAGRLKSVLAQIQSARAAGSIPASRESRDRRVRSEGDRHPRRHGGRRARRGRPEEDRSRDGRDGDDDRAPAPRLEHPPPHPRRTSGRQRPSPTR